MAIKKIWIKLFVEILDDPKMGQMPDWLWRRAVELFLAAGENGNDGVLPPVTQLAWRLRLDETKLSESLRALSEVGVVHKHETKPDQWVVSKFSDRQKPLTGAERQAAYRIRKKTSSVTNSDKKNNEKRNEKVTLKEEEVEEEKEEEKEKEKRASSAPPDTEKPADDLFEEFQRELETIIGLPLKPDSAVSAINEMISMGADISDIREAAAWYRSQGKTIFSVRSLIGPTKVATMKRKQSKSNDQKPENPDRFLADPFAQFYKVG